MKQWFIHCWWLKVLRATAILGICCQAHFTWNTWVGVKVKYALQQGPLPAAKRGGQSVASPMADGSIAQGGSNTVLHHMAPGHEAFHEVSLCFKANVMWLPVRNKRVVLEMMSSPTMSGMLLERGDWDILTKHKDTIDHNMMTTDTSGEDVRVWVVLKIMNIITFQAQLKLQLHHQRITIVCANRRYG